MTLTPLPPGMLTPQERARLGDVRPELLQQLLALQDSALQQLGYVLAVPVDGGTRTNARQAQLYADSLAQGGGVLAYPVATPGSGRHEFGAAVDLHIIAGGSDDDGRGSDDDYRALADVALQLGLVPGYYFDKSDPYHFQLNEPLTQSQARWAAMQNAGSNQLLVVLAIAAGLGALLSHR
jgi:hypothetical protein